MIPVIAGALTNVAVVTPTDRALYNSQLPLTVAGYDTFGNQVEQSSFTYRLSASAGNIIANGMSAQSVELQQLNGLDDYFLDLTGVPSSTSEVTITLEPVNAPAGTVAPRNTKTISLTQGTLNIKYNTQTVSNISLTLPENTSSYFSLQNNIAQLQESALPRIVLTLTATDGRPLDSTAIIRSTQGLLIP